jgi:hypothetical protein
MKRGFPNAFRPSRIEALHRALDDELLVYDSETHRAHCLNKSAAIVWLACDGTATISEIVRHLAAETGRHVDESEVWLALMKLERAGLLLNGKDLLRKSRRQSRRSLLRKLGVAAAASLPVVTSMLVPMPADAASCFPLLHSCSTNAQCCSGHCGASGIHLVCLP